MVTPVMLLLMVYGNVDVFFFFSSRRRHTRFDCDWSSDVCSSDLRMLAERAAKMRSVRWVTIGPNYEYGKRAWETFRDRLKELRSDVQIVGEHWQIGRASCRERV